MQKTRIIAIAVLIVGGGLARHVARAQQPGSTRTDRATVPSGCRLAARSPGSQTSAWRIICNPACNFRR